MRVNSGIFAITLGAIAVALAPVFATTPAAKVSTVFEFSNGTRPENLAVRANGQVLVTRIDYPQLFLVDPVAKTNTLIYESTDAVNSLFGITEVETDVFVVIAGNYSSTTGNTPGTYSTWAVDLREYEATQSVNALKIAAMPEAGLLNGITKLSPTSTKVLIADSLNGAVFAVDYKTGQYEKTITDNSLTSPDSAPIKIGVNGIKTHGGYAYYTNFAQNIVYRVAIDDDGRPTCAPKPLATVTGDDLFLSEDGETVYVAGVFSNDVVAIDVASGETRVVAGSPDSLAIHVPTALALGRTSKDRTTLYVTTTGGVGAAVEGVLTSAKLVAVEMAHDQC